MGTCGMRFHDSVCGLETASPRRDTICGLNCFPSMKGLPAETDFVVLGAGVAGLRAAIELAAAGRVLVLAKKEITKPQEPAHGLASVLSDEDEIPLHLQDTLTAGDGLCNPAAVKIL